MFKINAVLCPLHQCLNVVCSRFTEAVTDLVICRLSKQSGSAKGGDEVFILCEKVTKGKLQITSAKGKKYT